MNSDAKLTSHFLGSDEGTVLIIHWLQCVRAVVQEHSRLGWLNLPFSPVLRVMTHFC